MAGPRRRGTKQWNGHPYPLDSDEVFDDVDNFLRGEPITTADLRRMSVASGGAHAARARGR